MGFTTVMKMAIKDSPRLRPGQEVRRDAAKRLGLNDAQYELAIKLGFPVGEKVIWTRNTFDPDPRVAWVVSSQAADDWAKAVAEIARVL